ncbi:MAG TPA: hypothetical protein VHK86_01255, partial [Nitrososphaera sp.]|nr:hypothetical protein [Nitrososphaera sp.]
MPAKKLDVNCIQAVLGILLGYPRETIEAITGYSGGLQEDVKQVIRDDIGDEKFNALRKTFQLANNRNIDSVGVVAGFEQDVLMSLSNIDVKESSPWLNETFEVCARQNKMTPTQFGGLLSVVGKVVEEEKVSDPAELPDRVRALARSEREGVEKCASIDARVNQKLALENVTEEDLSAFKKFEAELEEEGLSIRNDPQKAINCIKNCKDLDYDSKKVVQKLSQLESVDAELVEKEKKRDEAIRETEMAHREAANYKDQKVARQSELHELNNEYEAKAKPINALNRLNSKLVEDETIIRFDRALAKVADQETMIQEFEKCGNLNEYYRSLQGLKTEIMKENEKFSNQRDKLISEIAYLDGKYAIETKRLESNRKMAEIWKRSAIVHERATKRAVEEMDKVILV